MAIIDGAGLEFGTSFHLVIFLWCGTMVYCELYAIEWYCWAAA
jgi:hypothetical protein